MPQIQVFHADTPDFFAERLYQFPQGFTHVADVQTSQTGMLALDLAFRRTQHMGVSWTQHAEVTAHQPDPRSTSVGDVLICEGKIMAVKDVGWEELPAGTS